jgi:CRISPR-associated endonuclease Csn1
VIAAGAWVFDVPETDKERTPKNQLRRGFRGLRRVIHRRAERMGKIRSLFAEHGLLSSADRDALWIKDADGRLLDPWHIRAVGLDRALSGPELAVAVGHLAQHRGFKSNSKRDRGANAPKEGKALLAGVAALHEATAKYRTVGETLAKDAAYAARKRNRENDYARTPLRQDHEHEAKLLFERQRSLGNPHATPDLEEAFAKLAFSQRPLQDRPDAAIRSNCFGCYRDWQACGSRRGARSAH